MRRVWYTVSLGLFFSIFSFPSELNLDMGPSSDGRIVVPLLDLFGNPICCNSAIDGLGGDAICTLLNFWRNFASFLILPLVNVIVVAFLIVAK